MQITINDNNVISSVEINPVSSPVPIIFRIRYNNGKLTIDGTSFAFQNLVTSLDYVIEDNQTLNFNFILGNTPDSLTLTQLLDEFTLTEGTTILIQDENSNITINRELGLPLIFKSRTGEILSSTYYRDSLVVSVSENTISSSSGVSINYDDEIEDLARESVSGFKDEVTELEYVITHTFNSNLPIIISPLFAVDYMEIIFYKNTASKNILNKVPYLTEYFKCKGTLKEGTSIINPSIMIDFNLIEKKEILNCNYCYIPKFKRFYYIEDIVSLYTNLFQVTMKVDVLTSFKDKIYSLSALVRRNEFTFNPDLVDEKMIQEIDYNIEVNEYTNSLFSYDSSLSAYNIVVVTTEGSNV